MIQGAAAKSGAGRQGGSAGAPSHGLAPHDRRQDPRPERVREAAQTSSSSTPVAASSSEIKSIKPPPVTQIPVGHRAAGGDPVEIATALLPRHTAIIAGAGSGKTVLLRRIVEEAALAGIPAIVIDPNNDLSRLGDAWPERPAGLTRLRGFVVGKRDFAIFCPA